MSEPKVSWNHHFAKCPYCGYEDKDSWELGDGGENQCGNCEREYTYERNLVAYFNTTGKPVSKEGIQQ